MSVAVIFPIDLYLCLRFSSLIILFIVHLPHWWTLSCSLKWQISYLRRGISSLLKTSCIVSSASCFFPTPLRLPIPPLVGPPGFSTLQKTRIETSFFLTAISSENHTAKCDSSEPYWPVPSSTDYLPKQRYTPLLATIVHEP